MHTMFPMAERIAVISDIHADLPASQAALTRDDVDVHGLSAAASCRLGIALR
jgi:hypothetical protein